MPFFKDYYYRVSTPSYICQFVITHSYAELPPPEPTIKPMTPPAGVFRQFKVYVVSDLPQCAHTPVVEYHPFNNLTALEQNNIYKELQETLSMNVVRSQMTLKDLNDHLGIINTHLVFVQQAPQTSSMPNLDYSREVSFFTAHKTRVEHHIQLFTDILQVDNYLYQLVRQYKDLSFFS